MDDDHFFLGLCPDSVWMQLPGGPTAANDDLDERWQYMCSWRQEDRVRHEFRHRAHPDFDDARVYAHVTDDHAGPRLSRLVADGRELPLPDAVGSPGSDLRRFETLPVRDRRSDVPGGHLASPGGAGRWGS
jgi:hypothetical protein